MADKLLQLPPAVLISTFVTLFLCVVILVIVAFRQGREISFWPPRIGPKLTATPSKSTSPEPEPLPDTSEQLSVVRQARIAPNRRVTPTPTPTPSSPIPWADIRLYSDTIVTLELLSQTDHSTIHTCRLSPPNPVGTFVLKRTISALSDFEALQKLVAVSRKRLSPLSVIPLAVWKEGKYVFELQEFAPGTSLGRLVMRNAVPLARGALLRALLTGFTRELNWLRDVAIIHRDISPFNIILTE
jgi:hypothetical protein